MKDLQEQKQHGKPYFPFAVYPCSVEVNRKGTPLHWHEELELIYIVSGDGSVNVQGEYIGVEMGDIVLVPPQRVHGIDQGESNAMTHYALLFRPSMLGTDYANILMGNRRMLPTCIPKTDPLNGKLTPLILELSQNRKKADTDYSLMILSMLYAIAYHIIHDTPESEGNDRGRYMYYDRLKVILEYLQENYMEKTSIEEAAAMCGFSASHFMKLFRELTGSSFTQYVKNLRLETAAKLLRTTDHQVCDIAQSVGFHNLPYFTRAFGTKFRMSPSQYRTKQ